jgi:hypothetical protein
MAALGLCLCVYRTMSASFRISSALVALPTTMPTLAET